MAWAMVKARDKMQGRMSNSKSRIPCGSGVEGRSKVKRPENEGRYLDQRWFDRVKTALRG